MGKTLMGGMSMEGFAPRYGPEQEQMLTQMIQQNLPQLQHVLSGQLAGLGSPEAQEQFQAQFMAPAMQNFEQQVMPSIQERFQDMGAGASSALNQALASSAADMQTQLFGQFAQQQQGAQQQALSQLIQLLSQPQHEALIRQDAGLLPGIISGLSQIGSGAAMAASSELVKENITDYQDGLETVKNMNVKKYDYKQEFGGGKDMIGVIAEDIPEDLTGEIDGIKAVNLYSLIGVLINSVKELNQKVEDLSNKNQELT